MTLETKFDLGQTVHVIARRTRQLSDPCDVCGGSGRVTFAKPNGDTATTYCPGPCDTGGKVRRVSYSQWEYAGTATVGQIEVRASVRPSPFPDDPTYEERYMLDTTGIGTGTVYPFSPDRGWSHTHLFATAAEGCAWAADENACLLAEAESAIEEARA